MTPAIRDKQIIGSEFDSPYHRRLPFPKWNGLISVLQDHRLFARLPEFASWTRDDHYKAAIASLDASERTRQAYKAAIKDAFSVYGEGDGRLISGVVRGHFPESTKESLRFLAGEIGELADRSLAHWQASGRRVGTWRGLRNRLEQDRTTRRCCMNNETGCYDAHCTCMCADCR